MTRYISEIRRVHKEIYMMTLGRNLPPSSTHGAEVWRQVSVLVQSKVLWL